MPSILRGRPSDERTEATPPRPGEPFPNLAPQPPAIGDHVTDCRTGRRAEITALLPRDVLELCDDSLTYWTLPAAEALR